ncbi:MAG: rhodanese-like domain-containing protein [Candidatus Hodarchaeales archaeon]|jgi:rhodanese-related sulfurtransferase
MEMIKEVLSTTINVYEAKKLLEKDQITIFDIRDKKDFEKLQIKDSIHINMNEILLQLEEISLDRTVGIICYGGGISSFLTQILNKKGFKNVKNIEGGIIRWIMEIEPDLIDKLE